MSVLETGELMNLAVDIFILPILILVLRQRLVPRSGYVLFGSLLIVMSNISTIVEGYAAPALFDAIEHLGYTASGLVFLCGFIRHIRAELDRKAASR